MDLAAHLKKVHLNDVTYQKLRLAHQCLIK